MIGDDACRVGSSPVCQGLKTAMLTTQPLRIHRGFAEPETSRPLVAFLLSVPNDACRLVGGPQPDGQMRRFRLRSGRGSPPPHVGPERRRTPRDYVQLPIESSPGISFPA